MAAVARGPLRGAAIRHYDDIIARAAS